METIKYIYIYIYIYIIVTIVFLTVTNKRNILIHKKKFFELGLPYRLTYSKSE